MREEKGDGATAYFLQNCAGRAGKQQEPEGFLRARTHQCIPRYQAEAKGDLIIRRTA